MTAIHLDLEEYCQDGQCGVFDPEVDVSVRYNDANSPYFDTRVRCKRRAVCQHVCDFFEKRGRELGYIQDKPNALVDDPTPKHR